jgi:hypothetical protein
MSDDLDRDPDRDPFDELDLEDSEDVPSCYRCESEETVAIPGHWADAYCKGCGRGFSQDLAEFKQAKAELGESIREAFRPTWELFSRLF